MTQQNTYFNEDRLYKKKLFYDNGIKFIPVKAKLINDYKPPTPSLKSKVNATIKASAGLVQNGTSHYTSTLTLMFYSKTEYADWLQFIGAEHKFYDEKGTVYTGIVNGEPDVKLVGQETMYIVTINLLLIRKQEFEFRHHSHFVDIDSHWAEAYIEEMQQRGLVSVYDYTGEPVQYFRPDDRTKRAEGIAFVMRTYRYVDRLLRGY